MLFLISLSRDSQASKRTFIQNYTVPSNRKDRLAVLCIAIPIAPDSGDKVVCGDYDVELAKEFHFFSVLAVINVDA